MPALPTCHSTVEKLRVRVAGAPADVLRQVRAELLGDLPRADRLRLLGLGVACCRNLGDLEQGNELVGLALELGPVRHPVAVADFAVQLASFRILQGDRKGAEAAVEVALVTVRKELERPKGTARGSRQRRAWFEAWGAVGRVVRGEIAFYLGGDPATAFQDALAALRLTSTLERALMKRRAHLAALTLLCHLLMRFGPLSLMREILEMIDRAENVLIYRVKARPEDPHRLRLRWCRALVLARLGATRQAEPILTKVLEMLLSQGEKANARLALDALCWIIERGGQVHRAAFVRRKWGGFDVGQAD